MKDADAEAKGVIVNSFDTCIKSADNQNNHT